MGCGTCMSGCITSSDAQEDEQTYITTLHTRPGHTNPARRYKVIDARTEECFTGEHDKS